MGNDAKMAAVTALAPNITTFLTEGTAVAHYDTMPEKRIIQTSQGKVWITHFDNGDVSIWTPPRSQQSDLVSDLIQGRAAWKPKCKAWIVPEVHAEQLLAELEEL